MKAHRMKWLIAVVQIAVLAAAGSASAAAGKVYVADEGSNTVSVIDAATFKKIGSVPVGQGPHNVQVAPDGKQAWVANLKGGTVSVIDTEGRKQVAQIAVGKAPAQVGFTPDSRLLLVANQGTAKRPGKSVSVIDLRTFNAVATVETGSGAHGVVVGRDGRRAFVTNTYANTVSVLDLGDRKVIATVPVGKARDGISMTL